MTQMPPPRATVQEKKSPSERYRMETIFPKGRDVHTECTDKGNAK